MPENNKSSLRSLAKVLGVNHSTLSKIATGKYPASSKNIVNKLLKNITGVMIPVDKYQEILNMLNDAQFPKFGETSRTAAWLYEEVEKASKRAEVYNG